MALLESMACKPIISYSNSGAKEIISNKERGVLVTLNDIDQLAKKTISLLEDKKKREKIAKNANEYVKILARNKLPKNSRKFLTYNLLQNP